MTKKFSSPPWFQLDNYQKTNFLDFDGWRIQLANRIYLQGLLASEQLEVFDIAFSRLTEEPFLDLGFDSNYGSPHAAYPLSFGVANAMVDALKGVAERKDFCDDKLSEIGQDSFVMHAHLTIDLNASKTEITSAFGHWLKGALAKNREKFPRDRGHGATRFLLAGWHKHQLLPYIDLLLWSRRYKTESPSGGGVIVDLLFPYGDGDKDTLEKVRNEAIEALDPAILRQLVIAAEQETA